MIRNYPAIARQAAWDAKWRQDKDERRRQSNAQFQRELTLLTLCELQGGLQGLVGRDDCPVKVEMDALDARHTSVRVSCNNRAITVRCLVFDDHGFSFELTGPGYEGLRQFSGSVPDLVLEVARLAGAAWLDPDAKRPHHVTIDPLSTWEIMLLLRLLEDKEREILKRSDQTKHRYAVDDIYLALRERFKMTSQEHPFQEEDYR